MLTEACVSIFEPTLKVCGVSELLALASVEVGIGVGWKSATGPDLTSQVLLAVLGPGNPQIVDIHGEVGHALEAETAANPRVHRIRIRVDFKTLALTRQVLENVVH